MNLTVQDLLRQDTRIQDLYFNISEMKLIITSLFSVQIMSYLGASDMIYSDVIDSFFSEILKYKSWTLASWRKRSLTVRFPPFEIILLGVTYLRPLLSRQTAALVRLVSHWAQHGRHRLGLSSHSCFCANHLTKLS